MGGSGSGHGLIGGEMEVLEEKEVKEVREVIEDIEVMAPVKP